MCVCGVHIAQLYPAKQHWKNTRDHIRMQCALCSVLCSLQCRRCCTGNVSHCYNYFFSFAVCFCCCCMLPKAAALFPIASGGKRCSAHRTEDTSVHTFSHSAQNTLHTFPSLPLFRACPVYRHG